MSTLIGAFFCANLFVIKDSEIRVVFFIKVGKVFPVQGSVPGIGS